MNESNNLTTADPYLMPFISEIRNRYTRFEQKLDQIEQHESLDQLSNAYKTFGIHRDRHRGGVSCFEWVPDVDSVALIGDFNDWNFHSHLFSREEYGKWALFIPDLEDGSSAVPHGSKVKLAITRGGETFTRISPWIRATMQEDERPELDGLFWDPAEEYQFVYDVPEKPKRLRIYEAHVGMATEEYRVGTYTEFKDDVLPYISELGYNAIQLMAVMEHSYYGSFGYQVTNFFSVANRSGTPEELKALIDEAHCRGIVVLLDLIHSHSSKNSSDGLNYFNGTDSCFFHPIDSGRGVHSMWDSRLFNYSEWEVLRFLLSNLRYWLQEFKFDGFRFDGVTSMLYRNHGIESVPMSYPDYFGMEADHESLIYLTLANYLIHEKFPNAITIAEDVSGMPGLCRPWQEGGQGFDYRLAMSIPDKWVELIQIDDFDWEMGNIAFTLTNRRYQEKNIVYTESHDQALVGDKTIAFWLMDKEMYENMSVLSPRTLVIDRGIALHKMIRLITMGLGGEGYLNFMGNEFAHPEWIDFPRKENNESFHYCRRQWSLVKDHLLRYQFLHAFDRSMNQLEEEYKWLESEQYVSRKHEGDKVIVFERFTTPNLVFIFNFHPTESFVDYKIGLGQPGKWRLVLDTDNEDFNGYGRIPSGQEYEATEAYPDFDGRPYTISIYIPSRTALVLLSQD